MRAARIHGYGDASVIRQEEIPIPAPGRGEVLVKVAGTSFNPSEIGLLEGGAAADYAVAPARLLAPAPTAVPLADAAAIPVAGLTAWQAVHEHGRIAPGRRVLVNGAGGGWGCSPCSSSEGPERR